MYIVIAILLFGVLVGIHEFGHFITAKLLGVNVQEFAIGMGPALLKREKGGTLYSLRLLPIGGFCAMEGEDGETGGEGCFCSQAPWKRFIILIAGSAMNFLLGLILILAVFFRGTFSVPTVTSFEKGCPYEGENALEPGDTFYSIDGYRIYFTVNVSEFLARGNGRYDIVVLRGGEKVALDDFKMTPRQYEGREGLMYGFYFGDYEEGFAAGLKYSWYSALNMVRTVWLSLSDLVAGAVGLDQLAGPVGIVSMLNDVGTQSETARQAFENIAYFGAFLAVNLSVINLLPLPALDGGRVFFLIISSVWELVSKKKLNPKYEAWVNAAGMVLLLGLTAFVMYNDISRLVTG